MAKKREGIQHPDYEKAPMSRRTFWRRIAAVAGMGAGATYLAKAPSDWPLSLKDPTGHRSMPKETVLTSLGTKFMVSKIAKPADTEPPGELMYNVLSLH